MSDFVAGKCEHVLVEAGGTVGRCREGHPCQWCQRILKQNERILELEDANTGLRMQVASEGAVLAMTVARVGGLVEGKPTLRLNFLQRIDELVGIEDEHEALRAQFRWRRMPDEKPDSDERHLVSSSFNEVWVDEWVSWENEWRDGEDPVSWWMPLPEGPKSEEPGDE